MKTKLVASFVWYKTDRYGAMYHVPTYYDSKRNEYRSLDTCGYGSEDEANVALLTYVGDDIYMFNDFCLVKKCRVHEDK